MIQWTRSTIRLDQLFPENIPLILKFCILRNRNCEFIATLGNLSKLWSSLIFIRDKIQLYCIIKFNRIEYLNTATFYVNRYGILKKVNCSWTMPMFIRLSRIRISCFFHSRRKKMKTIKRFQANRKIKHWLYVEVKETEKVVSTWRSSASPRETHPLSSSRNRAFR